MSQTLTHPCRHCGTDLPFSWRRLPYDLLQAGRKLSFNLGDIFPNPSYPVVTALDRGDLEALYEAQKRHAPGQLGDNATKKFVLQHVVEIAHELIQHPADFLRLLLRRHYRGERIPAILDEHFIELLRQNSTFYDWPLETLVRDRRRSSHSYRSAGPFFSTARRPKHGIQEDRERYSLAIGGGTSTYLLIP